MATKNDGEIQPIGPALPNPLDQLTTQTAAAPAPPAPDLNALQAQIALLTAQLNQARNPSLDPLLAQRAELEAEISALMETAARYAAMGPLQSEIAALTMKRDRLKAGVDTFESLFGAR